MAHWKDLDLPDRERLFSRLNAIIQGRAAATREWGLFCVKVVVAVNATGAVATLSFMAVSSARQHMPNLTVTLYWFLGALALAIGVAVLAFIRSFIALQIDSSYLRAVLKPGGEPVSWVGSPRISSFGFGVLATLGALVAIASVACTTWAVLLELGSISDFINMVNSSSPK